MKKLLLQADSDKWLSLQDVFVEIAEAAPRTFLDAIEHSLSNNPPPIQALFENEYNPIFSSCNHAGLLWALEGLAWDPDLTFDVSSILARLDQIDPGSKWANRPFESLKSIFQVYDPQTNLDIQSRMEILPLFIDKYPSIGWKLLLRLIPEHHETWSPAHKMRWRFTEAEGNTDNPTFGDIRNQIHEIVRLLLMHVGYEGDKWSELLEKVQYISEGERQKIYATFSASLSNITSGKKEIWSRVRQILYHHRSFPEAEWSLPLRDLNKLEEIYKKTEPHDLMEKSSILFSYDPDLPEGNPRGDFKKYEKKVRDYQIKAIKGIFHFKNGVELLFELSRFVEHPLLLGIRTAETILSLENANHIINIFQSRDLSKEEQLFVKGFISAKSSMEPSWISIIVDDLLTNSWNFERKVQVLTFLDSSKIQQDQLSNFPEDVKRKFWESIEICRVFGDENQLWTFIENMLNHHRWRSAVRLVFHNISKLSSEQIVTILDSPQDIQAEPDQKVDPHEIKRMFETLYKRNDVDSELLLKLEWNYFHAFRDTLEPECCQALHQKIARDPQFFCFLVCSGFLAKHDNNEQCVPTLQEKEIAKNAWRLLRTWKIIPGQELNGEINRKSLLDWVQNARVLCQQKDRIEVADSIIGESLGSYQEENMESWPPDSICEVIDKINTESIRTGFHCGVFNKRGVVSKSLTEGGLQEKVLAEKYDSYSKNIKRKWPVTSRFLSQIASDYLRQAKYEDDQAQLTDLK